MMNLLHYPHCCTVIDCGRYWNRRANLYFITFRTRRYREKHHVQKLTIKTSRQKADIRFKWKISKRLWRSKQNAQKKRRERERNARKKAMIRRAKMQRKATQEKRNFQTKCNTFFKSWKEKDPEQKIDGTNELLRQALALENFQKDVLRRKKIVKKLLSYFHSNRAASQCLGVRLATIHNIKNMKTVTTENMKKPGPKANDDDVSSVHSFLKSPGVSIAQGGNRGVNKKGEPVYYLQQSLKETHRLFLEQNPQNNMAYSTFTKLRPRNIKLFGATPKNMAACERCANVDLLLLTLKQNIPEVADMPQLQNKFDVVNATLCAKEDDDYHKTECIQRRCGKCGCNQFGTDILSRVHDETRKIEWNIWCNLQSQGSTKMALQKKEGTVRDAIESLMTALGPFGEHLFLAKWQHEAFKEAISNIQENEVVQVLDFAQNYLCLYQDEAQGAHWAHNQATVHPVVTYYRCKCGDSIREESIIISDDLKHDSSAVDCFERKVDTHLETCHGLNLRRKVQFTDGAASQYKGKTAFGYLARKSSKVIRNFFGSRHGKGPCDLAGGIVKSAVRRAVNARKAIIRNAKEMYEYCKDHLAVPAGGSSGCSGKHMRRSFFYVQSSSIKRGNEEDLKVKTVKGTRKIHSVSNIPGKSSKILVRNLTCLCQSCTNDEGPCKNESRVAEFIEVAIQKGDTLAKKEGCKPGTAETLKRKHEANHVDTHEDTHEGTKQMKYEEWTQMRKNSQSSDIEQEKVDGKCDIDVDDTVHDPDWRAPQRKKRKIGVDKNQNVHTSGFTCTRDAVLKKEDEERKSFFEKLQRKLKSVRNYTELADTLEKECAIKKYQTFTSKHRNVSEVICTKCDVDEYSTNILPFDILGNASLIARKVCGDGNCLFRSGSIIAVGHEDFHTELRIRCVSEMCLNEDLYLDPDHLGIGHEQRRDLALRYSTYLDTYVPPNGTNDVEHTRKLYREHVFRMRTNGYYASMWDVHALAAVLQINLYSIYPMYGYNVRDELHRLVPSNPPAESTAYIMWTDSHQEADPRKWSPNHFVPLVDMHPSGSG